MNIVKQKDLYTITDIDELQVYFNALMDAISEKHPKYPEYIYRWDGEKIIEVKVK